MTIRIHSDFDGGNIEVIRSHGEGRFDLAIRPDHASQYYQWFYFRADGVKGTDLTLNLINAGGSAYTGGWENYRACVSGDNARWTRAETTYADGVLSIRHTPATDSLWVAYFAPYDSERHRALVERVKTLPGIGHRVLGQTLDGRDLDLFRLGEGPRRVWLYARQHPGETMAEWWMEGAVPYLASDAPEAVALRAAATFHIVLNVNPDGSARGHLRTNAAGTDLNRQWAEPSAEKSPEVLAIRNAMDETGVDFAIDVHGDEAIPHVFMAGFEGVPSWTPERDALYRRYLSALGARTPDFQTAHGYTVEAPGKANLAVSTNAVAERYGAIAMTLEMPFKDHDDAPDAVEGWSPARSGALGIACLQALYDVIGDIPVR